MCRARPLLILPLLLLEYECSGEDEGASASAGESASGGQLDIGPSQSAKTKFVFLGKTTK